MTETATETEIIKLMKRHSSVRRFTEEKIPEAVLKELIGAGHAASNWKNFQSYSVIVVETQAQKEAIYQYQPQKSIISCSHYLVFVGDLNRAEKAVALHQGVFQPEGVESLLISSIDAALAAENVLLAAESLGYGGVMVGLIRDQSVEISEVLGLPDYTYPLFGLALGRPARLNDVKPRLPYDSVVFREKYVEQTEDVIHVHDELQTRFAGDRRPDTTWSERMVGQWGQPEIPSSTENLKRKKLLK